MADIVKQFGINGPLLIAQIVNFALLLFVLQRFLYRPLVKFLDERRSIIAKSLTRAKEVDEAYAKTTALRDEVLAKARREAEEIVKKAAVDARVKAEDILKEVAALQQRLMADARASIEAEREAAMAKLRDEIADIIVASTEKLLEREFKPADEARLVKEAVQLIKEA